MPARLFRAARTMQFELKDAKTGTQILAIPVVPGGASEHTVRCTAGRQARRLAAGGLWILLTDGRRHFLYVGDRMFAACRECSSWYLPGGHRRGETCPGCREAASAGSVESAPRPRPRRRRARPGSPLQLVLPEMPVPPSSPGRKPAPPTP